VTDKLALMGVIAKFTSLADGTTRYMIDVPQEYDIAAMHRVGLKVALAQLGETTPPKAKPKQHFDELTPAQQAGILCNDPEFRDFLAEEYGGRPSDSASAAACVRDYCGIESRAALTENEAAAAKWRGLMESYRSWQMGQRYGEVAPIG
jgi:hypothetical protein